MKQNFQAFTLIEVIVATSILTLSIFGIYKLIGENMRLIGNSSALSTSALLLNDTKECLKSFGYDAFSWTALYSVSFGNNNLGCFTGAYNSDYSFSGVTLDSKEYFLSAEILNETTTGRDWKLEVYEAELGKKSLNWTQVK